MIIAVSSGPTAARRWSTTPGCISQKVFPCFRKSEEADPLVAEPPEALRVPDHDPRDPGLRDDREHLVELLRVLHEHDPRLGVIQEIPDLLRARRRIDTARRTPDRLDPEVAIEPLRPVLGEDGDVLLVPESEGQQRGRDTAHFVAILAPRYAAPDTVLLEADREPVALLLGLLREERRHAPLGTPDRGAHHHLLRLR